ncbi:DoxX family protein [Peribacillus sp. B-H-3]|jgi:thiosulfate dehydrogenase (quinone) large subunit|uniref:DoxX family protein n=1 Tax=Peribacillus sp. B-H-3 TaxID=3400420 RepID=UPI003B029D53
MFIEFLRNNRYVSYVLAIIRLYLGVQWMKAGWGKIISGNFDAAGFMQGALKQVSGEHPVVQPWWGDFLKELALPNIELFNTLVPWGEFLVGISLILGLLTSFSVFMGLTMNFAYMFSGAVSTNPQMIIIGIFILIAGMNAGKVGADRWVLHRLFPGRKHVEYMAKSA